MENLQQKSRTTGKKALAYRGKSGKNTGKDFLPLGMRVVLYLPNVITPKARGSFAAFLGKVPEVPCGHPRQVLKEKKVKRERSSMHGTQGSARPRQASSQRIYVMASFFEITSQG